MGNVGILGVGMYLPAEIRRNDWWPQEVVDEWMARRQAALAPSNHDHMSEGARRVLDAMSKQALDPFQGAVERRVMDADMAVVDMEDHAARAALNAANVAVQEVDLLLTHTVVPDFQVSNSACQLHYRLGLPQACFVMQTEAAAYSFLLQMSVADAMIRSGSARRALLVQSCASSRLVDMRSPIAPLFGDGATAVVLGPVGNGRGIQAAAHFADGSKPKTLVLGVPGGRWYDDGRVVFHVADAGHMHRSFLDTADTCKNCVDAVLAKAELSHADVDFLSIYQGTPWLRSVVQAYAGLQHATTVDTFSRTGYLCSALIPSGLVIAERDGLLDDGDLLVMTGGGTGMTSGAIALRWGV